MWIIVNRFIYMYPVTYSSENSSYGLYIRLYIMGRWSSVHSNIVKIWSLSVWAGRMQANVFRNTGLSRRDTHDAGNRHNNIKESLMNNHTPSLSTAYKVSTMNMKCFIAMRVHRSRGKLKFQALAALLIDHSFHIWSKCDAEEETSFLCQS
jgi:hypothetical protein